MGYHGQSVRCLHHVKRRENIKGSSQLSEDNGINPTGFPHGWTEVSAMSVQKPRCHGRCRPGPGSLSVLVHRAGMQCKKGVVPELMGETQEQRWDGPHGLLTETEPQGHGDKWESPGVSAWERRELWPLRVGLGLGVGSSKAVGVGVGLQKKAQFLPFAEKPWIRTGHGAGK